MIPSTPANAKVAGIYSCSADGQTWYRDVGELLTPCGCGHGSWELLVHHNFSEKELIPVVVGTGIMQLTITNLLPEIGTELNIRSESVLGVSYNGKYRVTSTKMLAWRSKDYIHILVERVGEIDSKLMIHSIVAVLNC